MTSTKSKIGRVGGIAEHALGDISWDPSLHPRDGEGRFIEKGDVVSIGGITGRVVGNDSSGKITVEGPDGRTVTDDAGKASVAERAAAADILDAAEGKPSKAPVEEPVAPRRKTPPAKVEGRTDKDGLGLAYAAGLTHAGPGTIARAADAIDAEKGGMVDKIKAGVAEGLTLPEARTLAMHLNGVTDAPAEKAPLSWGDTRTLVEQGEALPAFDVTDPKSASDVLHVYASDLRRAGNPRRAAALMALSDVYGRGAAPREGWGPAIAGMNVYAEPDSLREVADAMEADGGWPSLPGRGGLSGPDAARALADAANAPEAPKAPKAPTPEAPARKPSAGSSRSSFLRESLNAAGPDLTGITDEDLQKEIEALRAKRASQRRGLTEKQGDRLLELLGESGRRRAAAEPAPEQDMVGRVRLSKPEPLTIHPDAIIEEMERLDGERWVAVTDGGGQYDIVAGQDGSLFARGANGGAWARITPSGTRDQRGGGQVRARFEFAVDTGDADGTIEFGKGETATGLVPTAAVERARLAAAPPSPSEDMILPVASGPPHILGINQPGDRVTVQHPGHPHDGQTFTVEEVNPNAGGAGGGGNVRVTDDNGDTVQLSRYARVVTEPGDPAPATEPDKPTLGQRARAAVDRVVEAVLPGTDGTDAGPLRNPLGVFSGGDDMVLAAHLMDRLVDYKPDRSLSDPDKTTSIAVVTGRDYVPYGEIPGLDAMHEQMGVDTSTLEAIDAIDVGDYMARRDALFSELPVEDVSLGDVVVTQESVNVDRVDELADDPTKGGSKPVYFIKSGGRLYVINGHHRIAADIKAGRGPVKGRVLDLDAAQQPAYTAKRDQWKAAQKAGDYATADRLAAELLTEFPPRGMTGKGTRKDGQPYGTGYTPADPRNDPAYDQYVELLSDSIQQALDERGDTQARYVLRDEQGAVRVGANGLPVYAPERAAAHERMIADLVAKAEADGIPRDRKVIFLAGPSGAGKSTVIKRRGGEFGVEADGKGNPTNYVVMNPDDIKELFAEYGLLDEDYMRDYGIGASEMPGLIHEESSDISKELQRRLIAMGFNVVVDGTFSGKGEKGVKKKSEQVTAFLSNGYTARGVLVDGTIEGSYRGAGIRHREPPEVPGGSYTGRFVPYVTIDDQAPEEALPLARTGEPARSRNAQVFEATESLFGDGQYVYDNTTGESVLTWSNVEGWEAKAVTDTIEVKDADDVEVKAGGADRNRGGAEKLRRYWTHGEGAAKIGWGTEGDFNRCVNLLRKHMGERAKGYCNLRHQEAVGAPPGKGHGHKALPNTNPFADGVMVALYPPDDVAIALSQYAEGVEPGDMHVTLAFIETPASAMTPEQVDTLVALIDQFASESYEVPATVSGAGWFSADEQGIPTVALVDAPDLPDFYTDLVDALTEAGFPVSRTHGFTPHITLGYDIDVPMDVPPMESLFGILSLAVGEDVYDFPMEEGAPGEETGDETEGEVDGPDEDGDASRDAMVEGEDQ